jgi:cobalamin biosynthesis protein CbiG
MAMDKTMIIAGIGCRRGAAAADVEAAIAAALARAGISAADLTGIATSDAKRSETGIQAAAVAFGLVITPVADAELRCAGARTATRSDRVLALVGVPSLAEAAALAAAGPASRLIAPRIAIGAATCALAASEAAR